MSRPPVPRVLDGELLPSFGGEAVELGAAVVLRQTLFRLNPPAPDQAVQCGVQRPLLDLKNVVGVSLDGVGDGVPVRRSQEQRPKDQHVEGTLQELDALSRHSR
jgi:hypothetical protein